MSSVLLAKVKDTCLRRLCITASRQGHEALEELPEQCSFMHNTRIGRDTGQHRALVDVEQRGRKSGVDQMVLRQQAESTKSVPRRRPARDLVQDPESPQRFAVGIDRCACGRFAGSARRTADLLERRGRRRCGRIGRDPPMQSLRLANDVSLLSKVAIDDSPNVPFELHPQRARLERADPREARAQYLPGIIGNAQFRLAAHLGPVTVEQCAKTHARRPEPPLGECHRSHPHTRDPTGAAVRRRVRRDCGASE